MELRENIRQQTELTLEKGAASESAIMKCKEEEGREESTNWKRVNEGKRGERLGAARPDRRTGMGQGQRKEMSGTFPEVITQNGEAKLARERTGVWVQRIWQSIGKGRQEQPRFMELDRERKREGMKTLTTVGKKRLKADWS
ncbi:uncharacterized protein SPSK_10377 [Sporothrix schenckii 1099-18]|uniref:Uncharacterized protein n=1 Tax=Sporothrix schenckii 1099-18 TaxID=1397361 RepID=A0A0F2LWL5_SPOSC|nr:uncharacterized protein SPSK_10377 [Sporothrix schenckii 1099-18]KJR81224.1 hypothetical protein SPSK_10377 [Sporothrix schenckii 1099-18]